MNTSSAFPLNADGRHVLPIPSRILVPELLPAFPGVLSPTSVPLTKHPLMSKHHRIRASARKRNSSASAGISSLSSTPSDDLFSSSSDSEGASSVTTPSPSSSRSSSPTSSGASTCRFSLVPRGAPFPEDVSLNDIDPTDALLFFPNAKAEPTRAILLVGPAIARHMHNQRTGKAPPRSHARMHPYRIIVHSSRGEGDESCSISRILRGSRTRRSSCGDSAEEQQKEIWDEWSRGRHMDRAVGSEWRNLIRPRSGSASSAASQ